MKEIHYKDIFTDIIMGIFNFLKKNKEQHGLNYASFEMWLDNTLHREIPNDVEAFCFNIYEDADKNWSLELVGASSFDEEDSDWACDEVFTTRTNPFRWHEDSEWTQIQEEAQNVVKKYLDQGRFCQKLKQSKGIAVGFVEGDLVLL